MSSTITILYPTPFGALDAVNATLTRTLATNVPICTRTAAASTATITSVFNAGVPTNASAVYDSTNKLTGGAKILSVTQKYYITTANDNAPTLALYKVTKNGSAVDTAASVTGTTVVSGDDAVGAGVGQYVITFTPTTLEWYSTESFYYVLVMSFIGDADGVLVLEGSGARFLVEEVC